MTTNNNAIVNAIENASTIESAQAVVRLCEDNLADAKARLRELRGQATKTKSAPRECGCGCGLMTSGGRFVPGHDAKLRSRLLAEIRDGESEESERAALAELRTHEKLAHGIGEWDLGRDRKARATKEARAAQTAQDKEARKLADERAKSQRTALTAKSREETNKAAEEIIAQKARAIEAAKAEGTRVVPAAK